jgi:4'-phosphopantetheinyl transferase
VWCASLVLGDERTEVLHRGLAPEERDRVRRFFFARDRRRYTVCRALLRRLLADYLGTEPEHVSFRYGDHGKPALAGPHDGVLCFNLSHAGEVAIYAVARHVELGVDVERLRSLPDADDLVRRNFASGERAAYRRAPADRRERTFFDCWTRKEAVIKAVGDGLSMALDRFEVSLDPARPARLLTIDGDADRAAAWTLMALEPADGYVAALAVNGDPGAVCCRRWVWSP